MPVIYLWACVRLLCLLGALPHAALGRKVEIFTLTSEPSMGDEDPYNFYEVLRGRPVVVINFMIDCPLGTEGGMDAEQVRQCHACRELKPIYRKLAKKADIANSVTFAQVDIEAEEALAARYNVTAAPTLILFLNRTAVGRYEGASKMEEVSNWIQHGGAPLVHVAKTEYDLNKVVKARPKSSVLVVGRGTKQLRNMMVQTSAQMRLEFGSAGLAYEFLETGEERFALSLHRGVNEKAEFEMIPDKEIFPEDFVSFVKKELVPWFALITPENVDTLSSATDGIVWACFAPGSSSAQIEKYAAMFRKVAPKWKKYRFVYFDTSGNKLPKHDPGCEDYPSVVIQRAEQRVVKKFAPAEFTEAIVNRFVKETNAGKSAEL